MVRRFALAIMALAFVTSPAGAQQRHAMTIRDFLSVERPGEPAISPDGRWVAYNVTVPDLATYKKRTDLWLVAAAGGEPRRISTEALANHGRLV